MDEIWHSFLHRLQNGHVIQEDIAMLCCLVINNDTDHSTLSTNFNEDPWFSAPLITPQQLYENCGIKWHYENGANDPRTNYLYALQKTPSKAVTSPCQKNML
jgi:hypothetical protein